MLLKDIAEKLGAKLIGNGDLEITHVANLKTAKETEISFLSDPKYRSVLSESRAGAVILKEEDVPHAKSAVLVMKDPYVGQVPIHSGEIAEDLAYYFTVSEQTPSAVSLGVLVDTDYSIKVA